LGTFSQFLCIRQHCHESWSCIIYPNMTVKCYTVQKLQHKNFLFSRSIEQTPLKKSMRNSQLLTIFNFKCFETGTYLSTWEKKNCSTTSECMLWILSIFYQIQPTMKVHILIKFLDRIRNWSTYKIYFSVFENTKKNTSWHLPSTFSNKTCKLSYLLYFRFQNLNGTGNRHK
jgi:hypothetical protein